MTNKKAVTAKIHEILSKYNLETIKESYVHLYENIQHASISSRLSSLHQRIDELFRFMNQKNTVNKYYNTGESKELLLIIRDIKELKKLFMSLGYNLKTDDYYSDWLQYTKSFLNESGGSSIPDNYKDIEIKDVDPIFYLLKENEIVNTKNIKKITREYAKEQIQKCEDKISNGDYSGAITNGRSLVESVIKDIYKKITNTDMESKGSLPKDWQELSNLLNLHPEKYSNKNIQQILTGLNAIINGISNMRNKLGDSHGHSEAYEVKKHHAVLAVNSALTITNFLFETYEYQVEIGKINPAQ